MLGVHGRGSGAPVEIRKSISFDVPTEIIGSYNELQEIVFEQCQGKRSEQSTPSDFRFPASLYQHVVRELAAVEEEAIDELLTESRLGKNEVLAIGVHDAGIRCKTPNGLFYSSLCDAPHLAEQTGMNIIDAFPIQDIASHGKGGPIFSLPTWIFLKSETRDRILLDLGRTAKLTFLPKSENSFSHQKIWHRDIVPCGSLLDALTWELTDGKTSTDIGGRLAVQGCQIVKLLSDLRLSSPPRSDWSPFGLSPESYMKISSRKTVADQSHQDVLCTASCFIAEVIIESLRTVFADYANDEEQAISEPEMLVTGAGRMHGMLMNRISSQFPGRSMTPITEFGIPTETFDAFCTAMLTLMAVDHIPASLPHLTGSETTKPLGRITPGSITAWHRLLRSMAETKPTGRTLRSAM